MESIIETFHIDWKIIIAQAVNFAIVFAVLYIYALKPLAKLMKERGETIQKGVDDAKTNAETLARTEKEYQEMLAKARSEINEMAKKGKKEVEAEKVKMMEEASAEAAKIVANGRKTLEADKAKMVEEIRKEAVSLVVLGLEKVIGKTDHKYDEKALKELNELIK